MEGNSELNALVFSLPKVAREQRGYIHYVRKHGKLTGDGHLRLNEIRSLNLDADLVTLSACQTSLGHEVTGEGIIALPGAFFMAGARSVIASLWPVPDKVTKELMTELYDGLLKRNLTPATALREAQGKLSKRYPDPYKWGAFVIYGG